MDRLALLASAAPRAVQQPLVASSNGPAPPPIANSLSHAPFYSSPPTAPTALTSQHPFSLPPTSAFFPQAAQLPPPPPPGISPVPSSSHSNGPRSYDASGSLRDETSPRPTLPSLSMMELAQAKEEALQNLRGPTTSARPQTKRPMLDSRREPDPIDMHVLTELDAHHLFEQ